MFTLMKANWVNFHVAIKAFNISVNGTFKDGNEVLLYSYSLKISNRSCRKKQIFSKTTDLCLTLYRKKIDILSRRFQNLGLRRVCFNL